MNSETPQEGGFAATESAERADAARLLPQPALRDLPNDRLGVLRAHLMGEIRPPAPAAGFDAAAAHAAAAPRRRRRRWTPVVVPLAAAAVAAAILTNGVEHYSRPADDPEPAPSRASLVLENAADVVSRAPAVTVGRRQYVYIHSVTAGRENPLQGQWIDKHGHWHRKYSEVAEKVTKPEDFREWIPWSRSQASVQVYGDKAPEPIVFPGPGEGGIGGPGGAQIPYEYLAALPRDPDKAFRAIEAFMHLQIDTAENIRGMSPGDRPPYLFDCLSGMLQESVDPQTTAILYRAAARIRGTTVIPDAVDAAGRHGLAITLDGPAEDRQEWIFDKSTYAFLGFRDVTKEDTVDGPAGSVISTTAVLQRTVVDSAGKQPHKES